MTNLTKLKLERKKDVHFQKESWTKRTLSQSGNAKFLLADLLCTHNLIGMGREDVENLLGKPGLERFHKFLNLDKDTVLYDGSPVWLELCYSNNRVSRLRTIKVIGGCTKQFYDFSEWISSTIQE
ncbi:MAG: hypothetical protein IT343_24000 [Candidatus Melainabacteria bacterium]|jgi:hypothetical protein|nr:hypothetical protein [Candidatus Melainabacteria bacterium]